MSKEPCPSQLRHPLSLTCPRGSHLPISAGASCKPLLAFIFSNAEGPLCLPACLAATRDLFKIRPKPNLIKSAKCFLYPYPKDCNKLQTRVLSSGPAISNRLLPLTWSPKMTHYFWSWKLAHYFCNLSKEAFSNLLLSPNILDYHLAIWPYN